MAYDGVTTILALIDGAWFLNSFYVVREAIKVLIVCRDVLSSILNTFGEND